MSEERQEKYYIIAQNFIDIKFHIYFNDTFLLVFLIKIIILTLKKSGFLLFSQ
jgi:hypothetical protein